MAIPRELVERLQPYTKSTPQRMASMYEALLTIDEEGIEGDVIECGVWRGGNIMMARLLSPERHCWLYDTFDGMPEPHHEFDFKRPYKDKLGEKAIDRYNAKMNGGTKWDAVSLAEVQKSFEDLELIDKTFWIEGNIKEAMLDGVQPKEIAILRLDMDWYEPTKIALENLYPSLVKGGFLIIDDYGHWMGCKKAVDEYFGIKVHGMKYVDYTCVMMRKC